MCSFQSQGRTAVPMETEAGPTSPLSSSRRQTASEIRTYNCHISTTQNNCIYSLYNHVLYFRTVAYYNVLCFTLPFHNQYLFMLSCFLIKILMAHHNYFSASSI